MSDGNNRSTVQSIDRAVEILKCFEHSDKLGVTEISKLLKLHKSTVFGLVNTMASHKLLEKAPDSDKYQLGIELFRLGANVRSGIREVGAPHVRQLMEATGETVNLVMPDGGYVVYIDKCESQHSMRICTSIGLRLPMYCTAVGKVILAYMTETDRGPIISDMEIVPCTENTIKSSEELLAQLNTIKKYGYAIDDEELEYGLVCIAVPVLNRTGEPVAALSVSGPKSRMTQSKIGEIYNELIQHSRDIERAIW